MQAMILFGGGGHAAVVAEAAKAANFLMVGYLDDAKPAEADSPVMGFKWLGAIADLPTVMKTHRHAYFHAAIGDAALRRKWLAMPSPRPTPPIIHPSAVVSPTAKIGDGVYIGAHAVVNARAVIGTGVIINTAVVVEHDCQVGEFCHIAPGSVLAGNVTVGEDTLIGAGTSVIPGVRIGRACTIGAGSAVASDIADEKTAMGVPARAME